MEKLGFALHLAKNKKAEVIKREEKKIMRSKILMSVLVIGVAVTVMGMGFSANFSDTETSSGNRFTAGVIDLEVDCDGDTCFAAQDDPLPKIFYRPEDDDIKPGMDGEVTISLHLKDGSNDADIWMQLTNLQNFGGLNPEPEQEAEDTDGIDDNIAAQIHVKLWEDNGNNIHETGEAVYYNGCLEGLTNKIMVAEPGEACTTYYVGFSWELPSSVGNVFQGDYCTFDIVFGADQVQ